MFTLKLANNETFEATALDQRYVTDSYSGAPKLSVRMEVTPASHELEWYIEKLSAEGALDTIQVLVDNNVVFSVEGYVELSDIALRLLANGEKSISITVCQPNTTDK